LGPLTFILSPKGGGEGRERLNRYFLTFLLEIDLLDFLFKGLHGNGYGEGEPKSTIIIPDRIFECDHPPPDPGRFFP
jgi:hypothetical protein